MSRTDADDQLTRAPLLRKTLRDNARGIAGWTLGIVALVAVQLSVYPTVRDTTNTITDFADAFPEAFKKIFRMEDYTSAVGYLSTELFSATLPLIFIAVGVTWGARVATDEIEAGTADVLLSLPISRTHFIAWRIAAMVGVLGFLAAVLTAALWIGAPIVDMSIPTARVAAASWATALAGLCFGSFAVLVGALSGRRSMALGVALTLSIASFVVYSLAPLVGVMDDVNPFNPMQWTIGVESLKHGLSIGSSAIALGCSLVVMLGSIVAFERRDVST